jgi:flagella basal body P-ring formation protein FlgA
VKHPAHPCPAAAPALRALAAAWLLAGAAVSAASAPIEADLADRVRGLVNSHLPAAGAAGGGAPRVGVEIGELDPRLRLAPCRRIEPRLPPDGRLWGRTRIGLHCVEGERRWQVWLPVVVKVFAPALVPVRPLPAGSVLAAADLEVAEVDWAAAAQPPFARPAELVGRTLARSLQPGEAVRAGDLRQRQWFAAGDTVQVLARGQGFVVGGEGQALGPGIEGREVRVRTESGRVLTGVPVGERRVEVSL